MKKILSLFLVLIMLVSVVSCAGDTSDVGNSESVNTTEATGSVENTEGEADGAPAYDGIFQAGYARKDITPNELKQAIYVLETYLNTLLENKK